jgi:hypothetical protein
MTHPHLCSPLLSLLRLFRIAYNIVAINHNNKNSHIIQNVYHTLKIILKQYKIDQTSVRGGGQFGKHQTIPLFFKASLTWTNGL